MAFETIPMALVTTQLAARPGQGNKLATRSGCKLLKGWSHPPGLNRRPADYESAALPTELGWLDFYLYSMKRPGTPVSVVAAPNRLSRLAEVARLFSANDGSPARGRCGR